MLAGAHGVHVGQDDLAGRGGAGDRRPIGDRRPVDARRASRSIERARRAASYVAVGPIFGTATKDTGYEARGLDLVRYAAGRGKPVVAIGGITLDSARRRSIAAGATRSR